MHVCGDTCQHVYGQGTRSKTIEWRAPPSDRAAGPRGCLRIPFRRWEGAGLGGEVAAALKGQREGPGGVVCRDEVALSV